MAYTAINKSTDYFNTKTYTGNGGTQALTGIGHAPDMVWIKSRGDNDGHKLFDKVRGVLKVISANETDAESTYASSLTTFGTDGFTLGSTGDVNDTGDTFVSWNWKAGNSAGSTNSDGSQNSTVSVNTTAGFSIVKFVNNQSYTTNTFGHGLGVVPKMIIMRSLDDAYNWDVHHNKVANSKRLVLNSSNGEASSTYMNSTSPTNQVFTVKSDEFGSGSDCIAYCFAGKTGYSKFGSYTGNGNNDGTFVYTGFKPSYVMVKKISENGNSWVILDTARADVPNANVNDQRLYVDTNDSEGSSSARAMDLVSNGFKIRADGGDVNNSSHTYIYMAIGQSLVGSNNIPCTAR